MSESHTKPVSAGPSKFETWMDGISLGLAGLCGIHCLLTPVLLIALPILGTTFFVHEDFHFWMLMVVIPTTSLAIFMGCRRHKDAWVVAFAVIGMSLLASAIIWGHDHSHAPVEIPDAHHTHDHYGHDHHDHAHSHDGHSHGAQVHEESPSGHGHAHDHEEGVLEIVLTTAGGLFLVIGHLRNFILCRRDNCRHGAEDACAH